MGLVRFGAGTVVALALLGDAAPTACRSGERRPQFTAFELRAPACSCAPSPVQVKIDGREATILECGASTPVSVEVTVGAHLVGATSGSRSWPERSYDAMAGRVTPIDLGCPESGAGLSPVGR